MVVRVHYDHGTADQGPFKTPTEWYKAVREASQFGVWVSPTKFYLPDRITYIELIKEED